MSALNQQQFSCPGCKDPRGDPSESQLHLACNDCLDQRADPGIWDPSYAARAESILLSRMAKDTPPAFPTAADAMPRDDLMQNQRLQPREFGLRYRDED